MTFSSFPLHYCCSYSNNDVNAEILKSYTGSGDSLPALVLVNHGKVGLIMVSHDSLCSPTLEVLLVQIAMSIFLPSKDWFKTVQFCCRRPIIDKSKTRTVSRKSNLKPACDCRLRPVKCDKSLNHF